MSRYFKVKFEEYLEEFENSETFYWREIEKVKEQIKDLQKEINNLEIQRDKVVYVIQMLFELQAINENSK
jgi:cell division septum initiation protein DivIVA